MVGTDLPDGRFQAVPSLLVATFDPDSGLATTGAQFDPDSLPEAQAHLDQIDAEPVDLLSNLASQLANRAHTWHRDGRWSLVQTSLAPGVHVTRPDGDSRRSRDLPLDPDRAQRVGFGSEHRRVLAVRDERLALMEWARHSDSEARDRCFAVVELDERARLSALRLFAWDVESLTEATDCLEARWQAICDLDDVDVLTIEGVAAWRHGDPEVLERILHEDFQIMDQRSLSWGDFDKETFISLFEADARNVVVETPAIYLGGSGSGRAFQLTAWGFSEDQMIEALDGHFVLVVRDGQVLRCDGHDIDTREQTLLRLRELQLELGDIVAEPEAVRKDEP
jgi:hypothetical protein